MKLKTRFTVSNILMLLTPVLLIGFVSLCFLVVFAVIFPIRDAYRQMYAVTPITIIKIVTGFFTQNPGAVVYMFLWVVISIAILAVCITVITRRLSRSVREPIAELKIAADTIADGNLDFEVMGSPYDEFDELCGAFDNMRRELKSAHEREAQMLKERSMLMANISHDLKTPVTSIKGYIDGIRDGLASSPEKLEHYLDTIYSKARVIDDMVNSLSEYSSLDLSQVKFSFVRTNINDFFNDVICEYVLDLAGQDTEIIAELADEPIYADIDAEQMYRVIANLFDNSVKYKTAEHGIIRVSTERLSESVVITVADNGIGIDESELTAVFGEFYRVDAARNTANGSGLGLGIAKRIVEEHGGKIWLKSEGISKGTTAIISLPVSAIS